MGARIPLSVPVLDGNEWDYVKQCLDTNWVSSAGAFVTRFEAMCAELAGGGGLAGAATVTGTAALHLALLVAGVRPGDIVLTSAMTFIAPANAIHYVGAEPLFVDAEPDTWQMDPALVAAYLDEDCRSGPDGPVEKSSGRRVAAVVPVHILGHPVDMDPVMQACQAHGVAVIEDATESLGATYKGRPVGGVGRLGCFSFNGNKLATCGGGGMVVAGDAGLIARVRHLTTQAKADAGEYIHDEVGFNYRLTNLQAAVGVAQLERIAEKIAQRRRIAQRYRGFCEGEAGLSFMPSAPWADPVFWLSTVRIDPGAFGATARDVRDALAGAGIEARPLWQPLHRSPAFVGARLLGSGTVADTLYAEALSLPSSGTLSADDQDRVIAALSRARGCGTGR